MSMRLMSGLSERIVQVLRDWLPAELDLVDAEEADGITTPDIPNARYYEWDQPTIPNYPACTIRTVSSIPVEILPTLMGERVDAKHRLDILFHATYAQANQVPRDLQKILHRYIAGAVRVLCVTKEALQTSADSARFVELVEWSGEAVYGPEVGQESGAIVRTATLPITVRRRETR